MSWPLIVNPLAADDLADAKAWYDGQRAGLGDEFAAQVDVTFDRLRRQPAAHPCLFGPLRRAFVRRFPYLVIYRLDATQVTVVAVPHARRDPSGWQGRA